MKNKLTIARWIARTCCIAAIIFLSMFSLDSFESGTLLHKLAVFGMHMMQSMILIAVLLLAWRRELTGGILFILVGVGTAPFIYQLNFERGHSIPVCLEIVSMINLPFIIIGALFMYSYYKDLRNKKINVT